MSEIIQRTFTTKMPDKPGAFMLACKVIMKNNGNIVRVSFNKGVNLFIEVSATREQLVQIDKELSEISYVDFVPKEPTVLVMQVKIKDVPGALYPVLQVIDRYDVNISYLNSSAENKEYQNFNIGMEVENPGDSKKILDEVSEIYPLDVVSYNGEDRDLDTTVSYIRLANAVQKLFSLSDERMMEFIKESRSITKILEEKGQEPKYVFDSVKQLANFIALHRDLNFKPKITQFELTKDSTLYAVEPPCGSNTYVIRSGDDLLFIDSGLGIYSDEMITELREMFPCFFSMKKTIFVTHADADHCGLLSVIEGAEILATESTAEMLYHIDGQNDKDAFSMCYSRLSRILGDYTAPDRSQIRIIGKGPTGNDAISKTGTFDFGDLSFDIYEGNGGHLKGEAVLLSKEQKLLFTGDIYCNLKELMPERKDLDAVAPYILKNSDTYPERAKEERAELRKVLDAAGKDGFLVCGGHGAVKRL